MKKGVTLNQIIQVLTILIKGRNISEIQTLKILSNLRVKVMTIAVL